MESNTRTQNIIKRDSKLYKWWASIDVWCFSLSLLLIMIGVILSFGSSGAAADRLSYSNPFFFVYRQIVFALSAIVILSCISYLSIENSRRFAFLIYIFSIMLLLFILLFGHEAKGAQRWLKFGGFSLQPSEFIKPAVIILISWVLTRRIYDTKIKAEVLSAIIVAIPIGIFLLQPDLGQTILLCFTVILVAVLAGISLRWGVGIIGLFLCGVALLFTLMPHAVTRINKFLNPDSSENYQTERALDAIANGDLFGRGAGEGVIKNLLPDAHTDFIFSLAVEEWGLIGALIILSLFALLILRGIYISSKNPDPFAQLSGMGLFTLLGIQVGINIAVNLSLIPAKGMTLPFISYGGSSLWGSAITIGFALAMTRKRPGASILRQTSL